VISFTSEDITRDYFYKNGVKVISPWNLQRSMENVINRKFIVVLLTIKFISLVRQNSVIFSRVLHIHAHSWQCHRILPYEWKHIFMRTRDKFDSQQNNIEYPLYMCTLSNILIVYRLHVWYFIRLCFHSLYKTLVTFYPNL